MENSTSLVYPRIVFIFEYFQLAIGIIGVIGNFFEIIIFSRQSLNKYSYSFYSRVMAISDFCFMVYAFINSIGFNFGFNLETLGPMFCKIVQFIPYYFAGFSIYILTIIAFDRMITIVYSRRFLITKKRWFQRVVVVIAACMIVITCMLLPLNSNLVEINQPNSNQTTLLCEITTYFLNVEMWIILITVIIVNIIINNCLNFKTIRFIMASRRRVNGNHNNRNSSLSSRDRKFAICSVCLNLSAMILKLPFSLSLVILSYSNKSFEQMYSIIQITGTVSMIDNSFSFFINMFVNSLFYDEFLRLFGFRKSTSIEIITNSHNNHNNLNIK